MAKAEQSPTEPGGLPVRVDSWLWATRFFKRRSEATQACKAGHVKVGDKTAKASQHVVPGQRITLWGQNRHVELEVMATVSKRVGPKVARVCYVGLTPRERGLDSYVQLPKRDRGAGKPTARERREINRLKGRE